ncbi:MAG: precorrin-6y C5,15-methyltransferase (decarboxylating) subunit CbiE [Chloroflexi bacterium]|nr:precorrin-6y C5,15-methyltransferase (decarboxylating) subunit CbiE [Chloroflexota bacterium]
MRDECALGPRIMVLGLIGSGREHVPAAQAARVLGADLLVGGERQLACFPDFGGERLSLRRGVDEAARRLRQALECGQQAVVLASGDPLCYGIGASLRQWFAADELEIVPAPSSYQLAFAALGEPWHDAALLSAHARPLVEVVRGVLGATRAAILTDDRHTPAVIARALLAAGLPAASLCAICEHLAEPAQRIVRTTLAEATEQTFAALNVFVVWNGQAVGLSATPPGLPDAAFSTTGGLITKREIRLLCLAELAPGPGEVLWDLGAGSGAVGIEAARWQPAATVYAIERRAEQCAHIRENLRRFPAPNLHLIEGAAPEVCAALPDPDAVFVGGSGGQLAPIVALLQQRLRPGGRLVLSLVTLEHLQLARAALPDARLVQLQVSVTAPIQGMLRFQAQNPVFVVTWRHGMSSEHYITGEA